MKTTLEYLLVASAIERLDENHSLINLIFSDVISLILCQKNIFNTVPKKLYIDMAEFDYGKSKRDWRKSFEIFFEHKGVLLIDSLCAAAGGGESNIYRAKGQRLFLFENGDLNFLLSYADIRGGTFSLAYEDTHFNGHYSNYDIGTIQDAFSFGFEEPKKRMICSDLLWIITNIPKTFRRDYYLEYLVTPPDVDLISDFSKIVNTELWEICLSDDFSDEYGAEIQNLCIAVLTQNNIIPNSEQLINYICNEREKNTPYEKILEQLKLIQESLKQSEKMDLNDMIDLKPNFFGVGLNFNALINKVMNKRKTN